MQKPFLVIPEYRDYVWGGDQLRPGVSPTAEMWAVYENNVIATGPHTGLRLRELADRAGELLLGRRVLTQTGTRFPLLIKLLDCAQWLSLQVHPNDEQAARLEGPGFFGKTEAWHILSAEPGAQLIAGIKPNMSAEAISAAIGDGSIPALAQHLTAQPGDTIFMPPGTIHALGPGLLVYEVQQTSDLTYRVYDWGRPQTEKRKLHIDKSLAVVDFRATASAVPQPLLEDGGRQVLTHCPYFTLELMSAQTRPLALDTAGQTFHAITVMQGKARITTQDDQWEVGRFETILIPAACGTYQVEPVGHFRALKSSVE